jgi:hypothetical protein
MTPEEADPGDEEAKQAAERFTLHPQRLHASHFVILGLVPRTHPSAARRPWIRSVQRGALLHQRDGERGPRHKA